MADSDGHFGEPVAARYDADESLMFEPGAVAPAVDLLARLAGQGPALEFGVGTGRLALPLADHGVPVHGIDLSRAMIRRLQAKTGGDAISVTVGDFAETRVPGTFSLVYLVFNTIMNLTSQSSQVACFRNAAAHLQPGGCFVIEVMVPELRHLPPGRTVVPYHASENEWGLDIYDVATQGMVSRHFEIRSGTVETSATPFRYVWPAELDLMAQLAGLELRDRWADWSCAPFTSDSPKHISVWQAPGPGD